MMNQKRTWMMAGVVAASLFLSERTALAATYNWCPTASSGPIVCNNCTVNLTCDISGIGILIKGTRVTFDGKGHTISGGPGVGVAAIRDYGSGTTIQNVYVFYTDGFGIEVNQRGMADGYKTVQNVGVYGSTWAGVHVGDYTNLPAAPYPQIAYVRDSWSYGCMSGFGHSFSTFNEAGATFGVFERLSGYWNDYSGIWVRGAKTEIADSDFSFNVWNGVDIFHNFYGNIHGNTILNNGLQGFVLQQNSNFGMAENSGYGNGVMDCASVNGAQWGILNEFGTAMGPGCINDF